jgi:hypothetical protein
MMEAVRSPESLVLTRATWCNIPDDDDVYQFTDLMIYTTKDTLQIKWFKEMHMITFYSLEGIYVIAVMVQKIPISDLTLLNNNYCFRLGYTVELFSRTLTVSV